MEQPLSIHRPIL